MKIIMQLEKAILEKKIEKPYFTFFLKKILPLINLIPLYFGSDDYHKYIIALTHKDDKRVLRTNILSV